MSFADWHRRVIATSIFVFRSRRSVVILSFILFQCFLAGRGRCEGTSDPVLDLLLQKGIITEAEVQKARADAERIRTNEYANLMPPAESKWKIGSAIKNVELFGDARLRFEDRNAHDPADGRVNLQRFRYALRLGLRGEAFDSFYYGLRLETAANPRSPWVTFGTSSSAVPYQGPFGKSNAGIGLGQIYLGWHGLDWLDVTVGKMPNPIYTTPMVWDTDLNPEGIAEKLKYTIGPAVVFLTLGQFLYEDVNPVQSSPGYFNLGYHSGNPLFLLAWQGGIDYHLTKRFNLKVAPVLYNYSSSGQNTTPPGGSLAPDFSGTFVGQGSTNGVNGDPASYNGFPGGEFDGFAANETGINDLLVLEIPWELNYKLEKLNLRLFGDYAQNLHGGNRARSAYDAQQNVMLANAGLIPITSPQTHDTKAYQIGLAVANRDSVGLVYGANARKHAWEARTYFQHVEQYALDLNLIDSDFFEGRGNLEGFYAAFAYGFSGNVIGTIRYGYATRINNKLGTGGSNQDIPQINPIHRYNLLQLDLTFKF